MADPHGNEFARFERVAHDLLEIRLNARARIDASCISAIMRERMTLCGGDPIHVLVLLPPDAELDIGVMNIDHYQVNESAEGLRSVALVAPTLMLETMARLYAAYFPPMFMLEVFGQEAEARSWLNDRIVEIGLAGQDA